MSLPEPIWLLLALPLAAAQWRFPSSRATAILRGAALVLALLALAGLSVRLPERAGTIVVVVDRSRSMPQNAEAAQREMIEFLQNGMGSTDRLAVVSFGQTVAIEQTPDAARFPGFTHIVGPDASNLGEAIDTALSLVPSDSPGRLLILSDGRWTGREPLRCASVAAGRSVAIDYRHQARPSAGDLAIARIDAPAAVGMDEGFLMTAWVQSPIEQTIRYEVTRGDRSIASGEKRVQPGLTRLTFRDRAGDPRAKPYQVRVAGAGEDPVPENNIARFHVGINGPKPILHITPGEKSGLTELLRGGGLQVLAMPPEKFEFSLEELSRFSAVILENIPADKIGDRGLEMLASWVKASGSGLMVTGGKDSYGAGGYFQSPLEPVLPVSMELRQEHRKLAVAIVVALDRSGSMAVPVPGGKVKMDLANLGTAQVLDMLGPADEFGCIAVDTAPHTITEFGPVTNKGEARKKILGIQSMGGGIYVDEALMAAAEMIQNARAGAMHVVLFADAADAEQPGNYKELIEKMRRAGITVTAIGLGTKKDKDAGLLEDIAKRGGGRFLITDRPEELPKLFAQDAFILARSTFVDEPVKLRGTPGMNALAGRSFSLDKSIGGYNLCYLRPEATMDAVTLDEYHAPAVSSWQSGSGRVLCYTGEVDGKYAGAFAKSAEAGEFYTSLARWSAGERRDLPESMALTQDLRNGVSRIQLHLDPNRTGEAFTGSPTVNVLRSRHGESPRSELVPLTWTGPDTLGIELPLEGDETILSTVMIPGQKPQPLTPVCLPYSPEYAPDTGGSDRGRATLEELARATGGVERIELAGAWKDLPRLPRPIPLGLTLLMAAVVFLLLEVLERRTMLVSRLFQSALSIGSPWKYIRGRIRTRTRVASANLAEGKTSRAKSEKEAIPAGGEASASATATAIPAAPAKATGEDANAMLSALRQARERARDRNET